MQTRAGGSGDRRRPRRPPGRLPGWSGRADFTNNRGKPWRRGTFSEIIRNARAAADLPASLTFHDLRHHYASVLIAAGCSIKAVQEPLGHANASATLDTYSHLWPADDDRIRDAVQSLHGQTRPPASAEM